MAFVGYKTCSSCLSQVLFIKNKNEKQFTNLNNNFLRLNGKLRFEKTVQVIGNIVGTFVQHKTNVTYNVKKKLKKIVFTKY